MERVIEDWKAEEKDLCVKLHHKLLGLTLLYPPSEDFRKCLSDYMFIKPNQNGFLHTMHYLFNILDPHEFQRRFYWPVVDKRSEAAFRSTTVEYLKHINEKYNLNWQNIKSYLVVLPGGMKFITFMLDFVSFVIQQLTKQREKQTTSVTIDPKFTQEVDVDLLVRKNAFFKSYASQYISELDTITEKLQERIKYIKAQFEHISDVSGIDTNDLLSDDFYNKFKMENRKLYEEKTAKRVNNIALLNAPMLELRNVLNNFETMELESNYKKELSRMSSEKSEQKLSNIMEPTEVSSISLNMDEVNIEDMIFTVNTIFKPLDIALNKCTENPNISDFVKEELHSIQTEFEDVECKITDFHKMIIENKKKVNTDTKSEFQTPMRGDMKSAVPVLENSLLSKIISTPPIKLNITDNAPSTRLPLLGDIKPKSVSTIANQSAILCASKNLNKSSNLNSTVNKCKIFDPMALLRSIHKVPEANKTIKQNLSQLGTSWKERQAISSTELDSTNLKIPNKIKLQIDQNYSSQTIVYNSPSSTLLPPHSPHTPLNDRTRIPYNTALENSSGNSSLPYIKKLSAVKKVQDASINFQNMSTSPSGRLEALIRADHMDDIQKNSSHNESPIHKETSTKVLIETNGDEKSENHRNSANLSVDLDRMQNIQKTSIENKLLMDMETSIKEIAGTYSHKQSGNYIERKPLGDELLIDLETSVKEFVGTSSCEQSENNQNLANLKDRIMLQDQKFDEESLFNVSDSVLKDVSM
ncbi:augmin complex subunit dgt6 isoform X2 [Teleopsis dalmanni]|uniref:augmin complex subunit dgt6 isoform X2 n=1 Tax=Teleopsis dalmanni TaxID=139649 RepID=UPI0018CE7899|nr:augmin complex subunit dgt6 isoform X2 [Teleopsis dalmanni]